MQAKKDTDQELDALKAQLAQYRSWFRAIDKYAKFDFWFKDADSNYTYVNPHFAANMGRDKCQLQNKPIAEIFEGERYERVRALDLQIMAEGYLNRIVPCDASGKVEMHEEHRFVVEDNDGQPIGLGCFAFEITKRSLAEETLQQAETLAKLCSWRWAAKTNALISGSEQLAAFLGVPLAETFSLFPRRLTELVIPEDRHLLQPIHDRIQGTKTGSYEVDYRMRRADGKVIHVREKGEPFSASEGLTEYLGVMQDISDLKSAELALKQANDLLERKVRLRTAELEAATNDAIEANRIKSQFLANISHEIRTPLNGILGMSELLERTNLSDIQRKYNDIMRSSGTNLKEVINSVLDISRIENGKVTLQCSEFNLKELVLEVARSLYPLAKRKGLKVKFQCAPEFAASFHGDKTKIRQIVTNLVGNAIKFTDDGEIKIRVSGIQLNELDSHVLIEVSDTGIGFPETQLSRIFAPFEQMDSGYKREYGGTGLGLSIASNFAALMGGEISAESTVGEGSVFRFSCDLERSKTCPEKLSHNVEMKRLNGA